MKSSDLADEALDLGIEAGAGAISPFTTAGDALRAGWTSLAADLPQAAAEQFRRAVELDPANAEALGALGQALLLVGQTGEAAEALRLAERLDPRTAAHSLYLAQALKACNRPQDARLAAERYLAIRPGGVSGRLLAANCAEACAAYNSAREHFDEAVRLSPQNAELCLEYGRFLLRREAYSDAVPLLQRAIRIDSEMTEAHYELGLSWKALAEPARAKRSLQRYLTLCPEDFRGARSILEEVNGQQHLTPGYVRALFDGYAARFDEHLVERLEYRAPLLIAESLKGHLEGPAADLTVLDLGCGTGLAGMAVKAWARRLVGIDISPAMLARAETRSIYDDLREGEILAELMKNQDRWNVIVAADCLNYVGDLLPLFSLIAAGLEQNGRLVATFELGDGEAPILQPCRRYAHSASYIKAALEGRGLRILELKKVVLRKERGQPVEGLLLHASRAH